MSGNSENRWKEKYLRNLDKLEEKEKTWEQAEDLLRRALGRMAHTGYGIDHALDRQLDRVRDAIRAKREAETLERLSREAGDTAIKAQEDSRRNEDEILLSLAGFAASLKLEGPNKRKAAKLRKQLEGAKSLAHASPLLKQLTALADQAVVSATTNEDTSQTQIEPDRGGLLSRLLGGRSKPAPVEAPASVPAEEPPDKPRASAYALERLLEQVKAGEQWSGVLTELRLRATTCRKEEEALALVAEVAAVLSDISAQAQAADPEARTIVEALPSAGDALIVLLEKIEIPEHLQDRLGAIKNGLPQARTPNQILLAIEAIADLLKAIRNEVRKEKQEIERFLEGVTSRIQTLSEHVADLSGNRGESVQSRNEFQRSFRDHMDDIRTSMRDEQDIDCLKHAIEQGLDAIEERMGHYVKREEELTREASDRIEDLSGRLHDMKNEAFLLQQKMLEQREQAMKDPLTGVFNRQAYDEKIEEEYLRWKRYGHPLSILVVDIDYFKRINDTFGHLAGDKALKALALRLLQNVREVDIVTRYGGEEFVVIMPDTPTDKAYLVAEKLRSVVASAGFHYRKQPVNVTVSCGLASFREGDEVNSVFDRADAALYGAKKAGRNRTHKEDEAAPAAI